jgi:Tfp pilus assembly protein PilF
MKKVTLIVLAIFLTVGLVLVGCGTQKAGSSREAIEKSKTIETSEQQINYLAQQAKSFINAGDYEAATAIAEHILNSLDKNSEAAKNILLQVKEKVAAQMKAPSENVKKGF